LQKKENNFMKRKVLTLIFLALSISMYAKKGEMYVSASAGANFSFAKTETKVGEIVETGKVEPGQSSFFLGSEFGYFPAEHLRISLALSGNYQSNPATALNDFNEYRSILVGFNPNISYYVHITDNFHYTPEIGFEFSMGKQISENTNAETKLRPWFIYLNFLAFEFRVSDRFALGTNVGHLGYCSSYMYGEMFGFSYSSNVKQFIFGFNSASLHARFYLGKKNKEKNESINE
jgi:hypothetical protein